mmetsp:Transcript_21474/g.55288  ORF Transcript_21474/g.55288 Transcript_21474/m.55288 type:complete len:226 (-) Transcript_21474:268-945(-)
MHIASALHRHAANPNTHTQTETDRQTDTHTHTPRAQARTDPLAGGRAHWTCACARGVCAAAVLHAAQATREAKCCTGAAHTPAHAATGRAPGLPTPRTGGVARAHGERPGATAARARTACSPPARTLQAARSLEARVAGLTRHRAECRRAATRRTGAQRTHGRGRWAMQPLLPPAAPAVATASTGRTACSHSEPIGRLRLPTDGGSACRVRPPNRACMMMAIRYC